MYVIFNLYFVLLHLLISVILSLFIGLVVVPLLFTTSFFGCLHSVIQCYCILLRYLYLRSVPSFCLFVASFYPHCPEFTSAVSGQ